MAQQRSQLIELRETETELLLTIPAHQKERAKRIEGHRGFDWGRVCWVYPKDAASYDSLIAEFGDELKDTPVRRPLEPEAETATSNELKDENESLRGEIEAIRKAMEALLDAGREQADTDSARLHSVLSERETEIGRLRADLGDQKKRISELTTALASVEAENSRLRVDLEAAAATADTDGEVLPQLVKWAVQGSGGSRPFLAEITRIGNLDRFPIEVAVSLERTLRQRLGCDEEMSLYDLLVLSEDSGLLTSQAMDLAHLIRKQRNIAAHSFGSGEVERSRACLCLFAFCLLWRELTGARSSSQPRPKGA